MQLIPALTGGGWKDTTMRHSGAATGAVAVFFVVALAGCSALMPAAPQTIPLLEDVTFVASDSEPDGVSAEEAVDIVRDTGVDIARPPDRVEFGTATCIQGASCLGIGPETYTTAEVWLVVWAPGDAGSELATFLVDSVSGDILRGVGGP